MSDIKKKILFFFLQSYCAYDRIKVFFTKWWTRELLYKECCFNVNFNITFKEILLCVSWWNKNFDKALIVHASVCLSRDSHQQIQITCRIYDSGALSEQKHLVSRKTSEHISCQRALPYVYVPSRVLSFLIVEGETLCWVKCLRRLTGPFSVSRMIDEWI